MPVQRNLIAETRDDPRFARLPVGARLLYHYMRLEMDRRGIIPADAVILKQMCFRNDAKTRSSTVGKWLRTLCQARRLIPFQWQDLRYFYDPFFSVEDYAHPKEKPRYPVPTEVISRIARGLPADDPGTIPGTFAVTSTVTFTYSVAPPQFADNSEPFGGKPEPSEAELREIQRRAEEKFGVLKPEPSLRLLNGGESHE